MEIALAAAVAAVLAGVIGYSVGRSGMGSAVTLARSDAEAALMKRMREFASAVARGALPPPADPGTPESDILRALEAGWTPRGVEHQRALREALSRIGGFLDRSVKEPLADVSATAGAAELRERIGRALGSLEDLEFFLGEPGTDVQGLDLSKLVQEVTHEFTQDQGVTVRLRTEGPVRADLDRQSFMDATYLLLHNATRFGGDDTVDVTVTKRDGRAHLEVRDRGEGFSEEAFKRAFDPFYSTADDGLGLGLPHARRSFEAMGGRIELSNAADGGAKVEVSFPAT